MGQFLQDGENGQNVAFFWSSAVTKQFDFFNFSQLFLFCPLDSKNVFVLALAHLEPELELIEVWKIMLLQNLIRTVEKKFKKSNRLVTAELQKNATF